MKVTIKEIAKACGVSRGTVDRALNDRPDINPKTKEHVLKIAKELGYKPHFLAKSLATGKTNTIGLVVFNLHNEFFANIVHSAQERCLEWGYHLSIMVSNMDKKLEKQCIENLTARNVDGLIISTVNNSSNFVQKLKNYDIPIVAISNFIDKDIPYIGIDDYSAMLDATNHVLDNGYKKIIYVSPPLRYKSTHNIYAPLKRFEGYQAAIANYNLTNNDLIKTTIIRDVDYTNKILKYITEKDIHSVKTCILCSSDIFAVEIMTKLKKSNIKIPESLGIMGFDDLTLLRHISPSLATVSYPMKEVGVKAIDVLKTLIEKENTDNINQTILPHSIVEGETLKL